MKSKRCIALPLLISVLASCERDSMTGFGAADSPPVVGVDQTVPPASVPQTPPQMAGVAPAALSKAKKFRLWQGEPGRRLLQQRPAPLTPSPNAPASARRAAVWMAEQLPESVIGKQAVISQAPFVLNTFRARLHSFELGRRDDQSLADYQLVLEEAADAARANQHLNYMPIVAARVQFETASEEKPRQYFAVGPLRGVARSQLITFGLRPEFVLTNVGPPPISIELSVLDRSYTLPIGGQVEIGFAAAGTYHFTSTTHFSDGSVHRSTFDFEIKPLSDGSFFNSKVGDNGVVDFTIAASEG